ncbi:MAG: YqaJ viral recombinase family protein [Pisciglobus halotolerans]|nr:YqaJ viral recombinase family protein [Pisciglobus halotolerans]
MTEKISTKDMTYYDWLQQRRGSLGGSDVSAVLGFNKYRSTYQLWLDKTGQIEIDDDEPSEAAHFGNILEQVVADEFVRRTGIKVRNDNKMHFKKEKPYLSANIDRAVIGENAFLECKTASEWLKNDWNEEEIPTAYMLQIQHYMNVLGSDYCYIAALIGGNKFIWKKVERDQELIDLIEQRLTDFWEVNVVKKVEPAMDGSKATEDFVNQRYHEEGSEELLLHHDTDEALDTLDELKETIKQLETSKKAIENDLKNKLGKADANIAISPRRLIAWNAITSNRLDTKKLKEEQPEIYEKYIKQNSYKKLTIKGIE